MIIIDKIFKMTENNSIFGESINENKLKSQEALETVNTLYEEGKSSNDDDDDNKKESSNSISSVELDHDGDEEEDFHFKLKTKRKIILSDNEDNEETEDNINTEENNDSGDELNDIKDKEEKTNIRIRRISDSEPEENYGFMESPGKTLPMKLEYKSDIFDAELSDDNERNITEDLGVNLEENVNSSSSKYTKVQYKSDIFDSEQSDEDERSIIEDSKVNVEEKDFSHSKKKNKKEKKLSLKKRKENLLEIHSTTQKMVRESEIILPYHRPKQRTLMEFLNRRKNVPQIAKRRSLKMSMKDINYLREIEERKREVDKFYQSDDDDDDDYVDECNAETKDDSIEKNDENERNNELVQRLEEQSLKLENERSVEEKLENERSVEDKLLDDDDELPDINNVQETGDNKLIPERLCKFVNSNDDDTNSDAKDIYFTSCRTQSESESLLSNADQNTTKVKSDQNMTEITCVKNNSSEESEDDFKLHLDTEDFDNDSHLCLETELENNSKNVCSEPKDNLCADLKDKSVKTPKLNFLASKFPQLNLETLKNITPKIGKGSDGSFIDLDEDDGVDEKRGVDLLLDRFIEHSKKKKNLNSAKKVSLGIVSKEVTAEGDEKLVHSNIVVDVNIGDENTNIVNTPGARLQILKASLRARLLEQREKERQRRMKEKEFLDSEKVIQDYHDDGLPDEEAELTDQSDTDAETESEPEENDVIIKDKKRKKNKYLDEEAEEDEVTATDYDENDNGSDDEETTSKMDYKNDDDDDDESENEEKINRNTISRKSALRIDDDDSNDDEGVYNNGDIKEDNGLKITYPKPNSEDFKLCLEDTQDVKKLNTLPNEESGFYSLCRASTEDLFTSQMGEENCKKDLKPGESFGSLNQSFELIGSMIPAAQRSKREHLLTKSSDVECSASESSFSSLTPFSKLKDVTRDDLRENSNKKDGTSALNFLFTPVKVSQVASSNTESLRRCLQLDTPSKTSQNIPTTSSELLDLCSGIFTIDEPRGTDEKNADELVNLCSGQFGTLKNVNENTDNIDPTGSLENSNCGSLRSDTVIPSGAEHPKSKLPSDDDEQNSVEERIRLKKKKRKRILNVSLSDDEYNTEEDGENNDDDEEKVDREIRDEEQGMLSDEPIEYDENEEPILKSEKFQGFKDVLKGGIRSDFLEKEAELSGSEEGSDDEEEPDEENDFMEQEEGDTERFDEDELRNQVGRAHLKSLIDSDKRQIRLLQELYLEDGDLHGEGRQRKFRWRNIDDDEDAGGNNQLSEDEEKDEIEEETDWRKERFEREKYLLEKKDKEETEEETNTPIMQRSSSLKLVKNSSLKKSVLTPSNETHSQEFSLFQSSLKKRGSFLSRDNSTLEKLASFSKENVSSIGGARQGGNFVFQTLTEEGVEKRSKEVDARRVRSKIGKPPEKKMRIERSFFSMEENVQSLSVFKHL